MRRLRVGVAGLGFGLAHVDAYAKLSDRFEVAAVCDPGDAKRSLARSFFGVEHTVSTFDELLDVADLDVIDVSTPPSLHVEMVTAALARGVHVVCEKPLAASLDDVDRLAAAESAAAGRLMPIYQYRFGNGVARLRRLAEAGVTGRALLASVETFWRRGPDYYEAEWRGRLDTEWGGVCAMHAIHAHDLLTSILGPLASVSAHTATLVNPIETEDCAAVSVAFESGALATLAATLGAAREHSRLRLHFEHLSVESGLSAYAPGSEPWTIEPGTTDAARRIDEALADFEPGPELLEGQFTAFHDAVVEGGELPVTVADARTSIELLTAIYHSASTGARVTLPLADDDPARAGWLQR